MSYTLDKTGVAVANRIALEQHVLTGRLPGQVIFLNQGAFHRRGLRIRHNGATDLSCSSYHGVLGQGSLRSNYYPDQPVR